MAYITKIDLAKQAKLKSGETANLEGSLKLGEGLEINGELYFKRFNSTNTGTGISLLKLNSDGRITPVLVSDLGLSGGGGTNPGNANTTLKYRGEWGSTDLLPYYLGDMVSHQGDLYVLTVSIISQNIEPNPSMTNPWSLISSAGYKGTDGTSYEIIFKLSDSENTPQTPIATDPNRMKDDDFPPDWDDDIMSPTSTNRYVYVSKRKKEDNGRWGLYQIPTLWSRYVTDGIDGKDGNTFQYIFRRFPNELSADDIIANQPSISPQQDTYVPTGWTDVQSGVNSTLKFEYTSMRMKSNGLWSGYSKPSLYAKYSADGVDGKDGASIEFIFYRTNNTSDLILNQIPVSNPSVNQSFQAPWTDEPQGVNEQYQYEYFSKRTKGIGSTQWSQYTMPSLWSVFSFDGVDGKDGKGIEFIFLKTNSGITPQNPTEPANKEQDLYLPNGGWTDNPQGVNEVYQYEWVCRRIKTYELVNGNPVYKWSNFSAPKIFAHYGMNGKDGNGFESIYYRTNNATDSISSERPVGDSNVDESFQAPWTDNPQGVNANQKYEFISTRKKVNGVWTAYSIPSLWSKYAMDGSGYETIYRLHNADSGLATPVSSNIDNYIPNNWLEIPPSPTYLNKYVFVCKRIKVNDVWGNWSSPAIFSYLAQDGEEGKDGKDIEFIYRLHNLENLSSSLNPIYKNEDAYHSPETGWTNNPSGVSESMPYEYISKREKVNGVWSAWTTPKVWAKLGEDGKDGINGKDGKDMEWIFKPYHDNPLPSSHYPTVSDNVDDFVPTGWFDDEVSVDEINRYCYYSKRQKINGVWSGWTTPKLWSHYGSDGKDGKDIEFVFLATATNMVPTKPREGEHFTSAEFQQDDFVPTLPNLWSDDEVSASSELPFIWWMTRVKENGIWQDFGNPKLLGMPGGMGIDGKDGNTGDKYVRLYAKNGSTTVAPTLINNVINPPNWSVTMPVINIGEYLWMTEALTTHDNILKTNWSIPLRQSPIDRGNDEDVVAPSIAYRGKWRADGVYKGNKLVVDVVNYLGIGYIARVDAETIPVGQSPDLDVNGLYWNKFTEDVDSLFTDFLFAYSGYIKNLSSDSVKTGGENEPRTIIGEIVQDQLDPTSNHEIFSEHAIRQYYKSGRIALFMGVINNYKYHLENGTEAIADGWATINFKDVEGSYPHSIQDNKQSSIIFIKEIAESWEELRFVQVATVNYTTGDNYPVFDWARYNNETPYTYTASYIENGRIRHPEAGNINKTDTLYYRYLNGSSVPNAQYNGFHTTKEKSLLNFIPDGWYCTKHLWLYYPSRSRTGTTSVTDNTTQTLISRGIDITRTDIFYTDVFLIIKGKIIEESKTIINPRRSN